MKITTSQYIYIQDYTWIGRGGGYLHPRATLVVADQRLREGTTSQSAEGMYYL